MKRLRSSDDLDSYDDKSSAPSRSSRSFHYKPENARKGLLSSSSSSIRRDRDRSLDDGNRESSRVVQKRTDRNSDSFDRRKGTGLGFDRYGGRNVHRSESFCDSRREFPKGFRSERERSRREGSVSSWRRFGSGNKDFEEIRSSRGANEERVSAATKSRSRDSGSEQSRVGRGAGRDERKGRSSTPKSRSSPSWSKDSESEQSKGVEVAKKMELENKNIELEAKSVETEAKSVAIEAKSVAIEATSVAIEAKSVANGSSSEMEEGELEPEPEPELASEIAKEQKSDDEKDSKLVSMSNLGKAEGEKDVKDPEDETEEQPGKESPSLEKNLAKEVDKVPNSDNSENNTSQGEEQVKSIVGDEKGEEVQTVKEQPLSDKVENRETLAESIDLEEKGEDHGVPVSAKDVKKENEMATESLAQNLKDKGKTIAIDSAENSAWIEKESRDIATSKDGEDDMEGPSTRGFELFSTSPVRRPEKADQSGATKSRDEKLVLEPLDLSLSLPNVLLPIGASRDAPQEPGSPNSGQSVQSLSTFRSNSDGFTASMSFSGSQSFFHNPSCSLTQNSLDMDNFEQSVHSRPLFQGIDWQGLARNDSKHKDAPLYQKAPMNGNGNGVPFGQAKMSSGLERQLSFHKQLSGKLKNPDETRSPSQSVGSHDIGSSYSLDKKLSMREKHGVTLYRSNSQNKQEQFLIGGADFVETIVNKLVSDPIHIMARKFHEMTGQSLSLVKETILEIMLNPNKQGQLYAYQSVLQNRSDLTLETLMKSHRFQLEILVALKTGLREYLQVDNNTSSSDLAEIFLSLRCRNLSCRNPLPVDECDCKVCLKKNGFCSACMCLVCSKFDMAYQTCSWVGCDVCLHWCHADCALRESYIRNGRSDMGIQGTTEMQFHCVACGHPSEMFGFVKEAFQNFARTWTVEIFCRELEYVKRIFSASKDLRGRRLHEIADRMLEKLAIKSNLPEACGYIMSFLSESDPSKSGNPLVFSGKEQENRSNVEPSREAPWLKSVYTEKTPQLERSTTLLPTFHSNSNDKTPMVSDLERSALKEPVFDELESIVRVKQAEAKMFQARADDARRESEGLKRIAIAKNEKVEEEYKARIAKLRIVETEEMRRQKFEEFQALERAHREYFGMKMRMEADIKDLLLKMEATKRNHAV